MSQPAQVYKEYVDRGVEGLMHAFSLCIEEMFKPDLIITMEPENPYAKLPVHVKSAIVQSAASKLLAQSLAGMALIAERSAGSGVDEKQVFSMGRNVLRHEFDQYLRMWRKANEFNKADLGKGSKTEHDSGDHVLASESETSGDEAEEAVSDSHHCGQDGHAGR